MYTRNEKIVPVYIEEEVKDSYLNYAMSVIVGRALPDARDGLKPVHRRALFAMHELGLEHTKPYKKCARIVGEILGKYHPHGDVAVYDSLVRMAQDFSLRYPLVEGQGNFGSIDGDVAAAMRYCVTGGTFVVTNRCLERIDEISDKEDISLKVLSLGKKINAASKWFDSGMRPILKTKTFKGYELRGTLNHPILILQKDNKGKPAFTWKLMKDLKKGDFAVIDRSDGLWPSQEPILKPYFPKIVKNHKYSHARVYPLPPRLSADLSFLMGAILAEGYISISKKNRTYKIGFCNTDAEFLDTFRHAFKKIFPGCAIYEQKRGPLSYGKKDCSYFEICSAYIVKFLKGLGLNNITSHKKSIPKIMFHAAKKSMGAFLRGFFEGDGSIYLSGRTPIIDCASSSELLLKEIQVILLRFGIISTLWHNNKRKREYKLFIRGVDNINCFKDNIGFLTKEKVARLEKFSQINIDRKAMPKTDYIPYLSAYLRNKYIKDTLNWNNKNWLLKHNLDRYPKLEKYYNRLTGLLDYRDLNFIQMLLKNYYLFDKIVSVTRAGKEKVYSLRVDSRCHSFVSNGFISHNTEARLAPISDEMLADIDKDTVNFGPNFDASLQEPLLLPVALPNLLINDSSGIAVGMATNIPPHNLNEVADAIIYLLDHPEAEIKDVMRYIKGPDFPTAGIICGRGGIKDAYFTGKGKLTVRARATIEHQKGGKDLIVVTEIPYQVQKTSIIENIAGLVDEKKIEGISDIRDESDKEGMRIVFELKRDTEAQIVLNQLFKHTQLEGTFGIIMLALVDNRPRVLNLRQALDCYIDHRRVIIRRRTQFELDKAQKRAHILDGLKIALKFIDRVIKVIKTSKSVQVAKENLMKEFGLSDVQAQAILEMQLQRLTALERDKLDAEYAELLKKIELCKAILASEKKIEAIIKDELEELKKKYGDERRTEIVGEVEELEIEDLIAEEDVVVTVSHGGYIKRLPVSSYRKQKRGGKGATGAELREEDFIEHLFVASTKDYLLAFTDKGRVHWLKVYEIPQASRISKGKAIVNLLQLVSDEKVSATIPVKDFSGDNFLVMATKLGLIKKTRLDEYSNPRKGGIIGITLEKGDELIGVSLTDGKQELLLATRLGKAIRFAESQVRDMGRAAKGVKGISLRKGDQVIAMETPQKDSTVLTVTELGFAKRTAVGQYRIQRRGGKGIINIKVTKKNGPAVSLKTVFDKDELMVITQNGMFLRCPIKDIRATGRSSQGVRLIKLNEKEKDIVSSVAQVIAEEEQ